MYKEMKAWADEQDWIQWELFDNLAKKQDRYIAREHEYRQTIHDIGDTIK